MDGAGGHRGLRRAQLDTGSDGFSEEELLQEQNAFLKQQKAPAAAARRIGSKKEPPSKEAPAKHGNGQEEPPPPASATATDAAAAADDAEGEEAAAAGDPIVGEVLERQPEPPRPMGGQLPQGALGAMAPPFPVPFHRGIGQSRFARRKPGAAKKEEPLMPRGGAPVGWPGALKGGGEPPVAAAAAAREEVEQQQQPEGPWDAERRQAQEEGGAMLGRMSQAEIEEARREIMDRLDPATVAFLRSRAASSGGPSSSATTSTQAAPGRPQQQHGKPPLPGGPSAAPGARRGLHEAPSKPPQPPPPPPEASVASKLRFGPGGAVAGVASEGSEASEAVRRDPLRADEGSAAGWEGGYTLSEAAVLARSSVLGQRTAALRLASAVLDAAARGAATRAEAAPGASWSDVWDEALRRSGFLSLLRGALDSPHPPEVAAASAALRSALQGGPAAALAASSGSLAPHAGPPVPHAWLARPSDKAVWEAAGGGEGPEDEEEAEVAAQLGGGEMLLELRDASDPPAALLRMELLPRIRFVLAEMKVGAAVAPLLSCLAAFVQGGPSPALKVARCPGLLAAVAALASEASGLPQDSRGGGGAGVPVGSSSGSGKSGGEEEEEQWAAAAASARPRALLLLATVADASPAASRLVWKEHGALLAARGALHSSSCPADLRAAACRLWRSAVRWAPLVAPPPLAHMDDAYGSLAACLAAKAEPEEDAREAWLLVEALVRHAQGAAAGSGSTAAEQQQDMIGPGCTAALVREAAAWLEDSRLDLAASVAAVAAAEAEESEEGGAGSPASPPHEHHRLQEPQLQGLLAMAAAMHFLATVWTAEGGAGSCRPVVERLAKTRGTPGATGRSLLQMLLPLATAPKGPSPAACDALLAALRLVAVAGMDPSQPPSEELRTAVSEVCSRACEACSSAAAALPRRHGATHFSPVDAELCRLQAAQPLVALLIQSLEFLSMWEGFAPTAEEAAQQVDAALASLRLLPPGAEESAFRALGAGLHADRLRPVLSKAEAVLRRQGAVGSGSLLSSFFSGLAYSNGAFPLQDAAFPTPETARRLLLEGYTFSWLGMIPDSDPPGDKNPGSAAVAAAVAASSVLTHALQPLGSRLPAPPDWVVWEAAGAPRHPQQQPGGDSNEEADSTAAAAALLLSVGLEDCGAKWQSSCPPNLRLRASTLMVFGPEPSTPGEEGPVASDGAAAEPQSAPAWLEPAARWVQALVAERSWQRLSALGNPTEGSWIYAVEAERLTHHFSSASFGDPLFAGHIMLLLLPPTSEESQMAAWVKLSDEKALHLLPRLPATGEAQGGLGANSTDDGLIRLLLHGTPTSTSTAVSPSSKPVISKRLATTLAQFIVDGHLDKARECSSAAWALATAQVVRWMRAAEEEDASFPECKAAGSGSNGGGGGGGGGVQLLEARAVLQRFVRRLPVEVAARAIFDGLRCGCSSWGGDGFGEGPKAVATAPASVGANWVATACADAAAHDADFASRVNAVQEALLMFT